MRIALVSREVYPLAVGGIGEFVSAAARLLSRVAEVTVLTTSHHAEIYRQLEAANDPRLPPDGVRMAFVAEPRPEELGGWYDVMQCYSARVLARLRELYPERPPDLIEFPDFLAEGFVTVQASQALDPFLAQTCVCVRIHTSAEMTEVLNGYYHSELPRQVVYAMERYCLANADRVIWPLGDVLGTYQRFYADTGLAASTRIGYPYAGGRVDPAEERGYSIDRPLRLLYVGRLERRKGVVNLVEAARGLDRDDFRLTIAGGDTHTGPLGGSVRDLLQLAVADDPRFDLRGAVERRAVAEKVRDHDVVVVPSRWECGPYTALEALWCNRPVLSGPVGGLAEIVDPGVTGWHATGTDRRSLAQALLEVIDAPQEAAELISSGQLVSRAAVLCDEPPILEAYQRLADSKRPANRSAPDRGSAPQRISAPDRPPLVSAIVPYYRSSKYVRATIDSLLAQTHPRLEIVLVNDGSFAEEDWVLSELVAHAPVVLVSQVNSGLGAARNFGISQARGRYVFPLDSDNFAHPTFVERCLKLLERRTELAYATSWSRYVTEDGAPRPGPLGYQPLGNRPAQLLADEDVAGDAAAVFPRRVFDLGFRYREELTACEDWHFYRELGRSGHFGAVIPERLLYYRVRADSMQAEFGLPRRERILGEIEGLMAERAMSWTDPELASR